MVSCSALLQARKAGLLTVFPPDSSLLHSVNGLTILPILSAYLQASSSRDAQLQSVEGNPPEESLTGMLKASLQGGEQTWSLCIT